MQLDKLCEHRLVSQIEQRLWKAAQPTSDRWVQDGMVEGQATSKQRRAQEDVEAIGGLRSPHISVSKFPQATLCGQWMDGVLAECLPSDSTCADILSTLGTEDTPLLLMREAVKYQGDALREARSSMP